MILKIEQMSWKGIGANSQSWIGTNLSSIRRPFLLRNPYEFPCSVVLQVYGCQRFSCHADGVFLDTLRRAASRQTVMMKISLLTFQVMRHFANELMALVDLLFPFVFKWFLIVSSLKVIWTRSVHNYKESSLYAHENVRAQHQGRSCMGVLQGILWTLKTKVLLCDELTLRLCVVFSSFLTKLSFQTWMPHGLHFVMLFFPCGMHSCHASCANMMHTGGMRSC